MCTFTSLPELEYTLQSFNLTMVLEPAGLEFLLSCIHIDWQFQARLLGSLGR